MSSPLEKLTDYHSFGNHCDDGIHHIQDGNDVALFVFVSGGEQPWNWVFFEGQRAFLSCAMAA